MQSSQSVVAMVSTTVYTVEQQKAAKWNPFTMGGPCPSFFVPLYIFCSNCIPRLFAVTIYQTEATQKRKGLFGLNIVDTLHHEGSLRNRKQNQPRTQPVLASLSLWLGICLLNPMCKRPHSFSRKHPHLGTKDKNTRACGGRFTPKLSQHYQPKQREGALCVFKIKQTKQK